MAFTCIIRVTPRSGRCYCVLDTQRRLHCFLKSAPEHGKANDELVAMIARSLGISKNFVAIIVGIRLRTKTVRVASDHTYKDLLAACGIEEQKALFD